VVTKCGSDSQTGNSISAFHLRCAFLPVLPVVLDFQFCC
jgi:hypothetical protein